MPNSDITQQRLYNLRLTGPGFKTPVEVVDWLVAVQSQDYAGARWALGLRSDHFADADVEQAFTDGAILRTHLMRPTWHFVTPADIRWLLALTAPRVKAIAAAYYRQAGLDDAFFRKTNAAIEKALQGGKQLTRSELAASLQQAGIPTDNLLTLTHIMMRAELDGVICSGARRGKQFTYALLEERVPPAPAVSRDEALAALTLRYFTSRSPATVHDFAKWSGLTIADGKRGVDMAGSALAHREIDGVMYWLSPSGALPPETKTLYLLPNYDEYVSSYADHGLIFDVRLAPPDLPPNRTVMYLYVIVLDGQVVGTWQRTIHKAFVAVQFNLFVPLSAAEQEPLTAAAHRFGEFLNLRLDLS